MNLLPFSSTTIPEPAPVIAKPEIDIDALTAINPDQLEDSYVYVHCHLKNTWRDILVRIWRTTYLVDQTSAAQSELIHAENMTYAPRWTLVPDGMNYTFLLIFAALPKSCSHFDLIEKISQPGGFHIQNIARNELDVYHLDIL